MTENLPGRPRVSLLNELGFRVLRQAYGCHHVRRDEGEKGALTFDGVALLFAPPAGPGAGKVYALALDLRRGGQPAAAADIHQMLQTWSVLNGFSLAQSGVDCMLARDVIDPAWQTGAFSVANGKSRAGYLTRADGEVIFRE